jgi:hypothetical protein
MRELMKLPPTAAGALPQSDPEQMPVHVPGYGEEVGVSGGWGGNQSAKEAMEYLYGIMERDGPFEGIIGYSEGATVAATLLLHEQRRFEVEGKEPMFKMGVFFAGWPPMNPDLDAIVLADESDLTITIPTCHISKFFNSFQSILISYF